MSKKKGAGTALADWEVHVQGLIGDVPVRVEGAALRRHKDGSYTLRDSDGAVVFDAPAMRVLYVRRADLLPEIPRDDDPGPIEVAR